jgi:hypothetical protein
LPPVVDPLTNRGLLATFCGMTTSDGFDAGRPPVITYRVLDSDRPDTVCTWRWWGPTAEWDVVGTVVRAAARLRLERLTVLPHGRYDHEEDEGAMDDQLDADLSVTPTLLKSVPLGRLMAQVHSDLFRRAATTSDTEQWARLVRQVAEEESVAPSPRTGRPALSHDLLREVAVAYLEEAENGRGLTARLAVRFDRPQATVRDWIRAARREHFLTEAEPGRAGAAPGWRLLDEMHADWSELEGTPFETTPAERAAAVAAQQQRPVPTDQPPF